MALTFGTYELLAAAALSIPAIYLGYSALFSPAKPTSKEEEQTEKEEEKTIMQAERTDLAPPKDDPWTQEQLKEFNGADPNKPIYVAIKGTVFDVSPKRETYGPGASYNLFAGRDASRALGKSSLKEEDASPDYSELPESERKVLDDWHAFFLKRYNVVGRVVDLPPAVSNL